MPYAVTVLTSEDLQVRKQSRSFPEAFREVPSVLVQKTAHGQGSPFIRGFTGYHTLLMVDGIRLNHAECPRSSSGCAPTRSIAYRRFCSPLPSV